MEYTSKRRRSRNWTDQERNILRQVIAQSLHIVNNKSNTTEMNNLKAKEWKNISHRFNKITGDNRSHMEMKIAWKRMKYLDKNESNEAKGNSSPSRSGTNDDSQPPSPDEFTVTNIPNEFKIKLIDYHNDGAPNNDNSHQEDSDVLAEPTNFAFENIKTTNSNMSSLMDPESPEFTPEFQASQSRKRRKFVPQQNMSQVMKSNINFKKRHLQMLEEEHALNKKIAQLKIRKLQLEIGLLENMENNLD